MHFFGAWYAKYSFGPVSIGYTESYHDQGLTGTATATTAVKTVGTSQGFFEGNQMSIAFNVNDNLSISYTDGEDTYDAQGSNTATQTTADVTMGQEAIQIAYSMGGMSIKAYQMEVENVGYDSDAAKRDVTEIALGLSF